MLAPADYENRTLGHRRAGLAASRFTPTDRRIIQTTSEAQAV
jgi:hypothetical protein